MLRLPSPFGVEQIWPSIFGTPKLFIKKAAIFGFINRIGFFLNPITMKHITPFFISLEDPSSLSNFFLSYVTN